MSMQMSRNWMHSDCSNSHNGSVMSAKAVQSKHYGSLSPSTTVYSASTISSPSKPTPRRQRFVVAFDWDDTLHPTFALVNNRGQNVTTRDVYDLGKSIYILLETYIHRFGFENIFIVHECIETVGLGLAEKAQWISIVF